MISNFCLQERQIAVSLSLYWFTLFVQPKNSLAQGMEVFTEELDDDKDCVQGLLEQVKTSAGEFEGVTISVLGKSSTFIFLCFIVLWRFKTVFELASYSQMSHLKQLTSFWLEKTSLKESISFSIFERRVSISFSSIFNPAICSFKALILAS